MNDKLIGKKINLRIVDKSDAVSIAEHAKDIEISEFTFIPHPYKLMDAYDFIEFAEKSWTDKRGCHLGIENKEDGNIIGMIGLNTINLDHKRSELGYWIGKKFWGKGFITEAIKLMVFYAFEEYKLERIHAFVRPDNPASIKVLENTGFSQEGLLRKFLFQHGAHHDFYIYSILREEIEREFSE